MTLFYTMLGSSFNISFLQFVIIKPSGDSTYTFNYDADGNRTNVGGAYSCGHIIWLGQGNADVA